MFAHLSSTEFAVQFAVTVHEVTRLAPIDDANNLLFVSLERGARHQHRSKVALAQSQRCSWEEPIVFGPITLYTSKGAHAFSKKAFVFRVKSEEGAGSAAKRSHDYKCEIDLAQFALMPQPPPAAPAPAGAAAAAGAGAADAHGHSNISASSAGSASTAGGLYTHPLSVSTKSFELKNKNAKAKLIAGAAAPDGPAVLRLTFRSRVLTKGEVDVLKAAAKSGSANAAAGLCVGIKPAKPAPAPAALLTSSASESDTDVDAKHARGNGTGTGGGAGLRLRTADGDQPTRGSLSPRADRLSLHAPAAFQLSLVDAGTGSGFAVPPLPGDPVRQVSLGSLSGSDADGPSPARAGAAGVAVGALGTAPTDYVRDVFGASLPRALADGSGGSLLNHHHHHHHSNGNGNGHGNGEFKHHHRDESWRLQYVDPATVLAAGAAANGTAAAGAAAAQPNTPTSRPVSTAVFDTTRWAPVDTTSSAGRQSVEFALRVLIRDQHPLSSVSEANAVAWLTLEQSNATAERDAPGGSGPVGRSKSRRPQPESPNTAAAAGAATGDRKRDVEMQNMNGRSAPAAGAAAGAAAKKPGNPQFWSEIPVAVCALTRLLLRWHVFTAATEADATATAPAGSYPRAWILSQVLLAYRTALAHAQDQELPYHLSSLVMLLHFVESYARTVAPPTPAAAAAAAAAPLVAAADAAAAAAAPSAAAAAAGAAGPSVTVSPAVAAAAAAAANPAPTDHPRPAGPATDSKARSVDGKSTPVLTLPKEEDLLFPTDTLTGGGGGGAAAGPAVVPVTWFSQKLRQLCLCAFQAICSDFLLRVSTVEMADILDAEESGELGSATLDQFLAVYQRMLDSFVLHHVFAPIRHQLLGLFFSYLNCGLFNYVVVSGPRSLMTLTSGMRLKIVASAVEQWCVGNIADASAGAGAASWGGSSGGLHALKPLATDCFRHVSELATLLLYDKVVLSEKLLSDLCPSLNPVQLEHILLLYNAVTTNTDRAPQSLIALLQKRAATAVNQSGGAMVFPLPLPTVDPRVTRFDVDMKLPRFVLRTAPLPPLLLQHPQAITVLDGGASAAAAPVSAAKLSVSHNPATELIALLQENDGIAL